MKRKVVAPGVYIDPIGRYWSRPWINGRRTNRLLKATLLRAAVAESNSEKFKSAQDPFSALAQRYLDAGCPDRHFNERTARFLKEEAIRVSWLMKFFGAMSIEDIRPMCCPDYKRWRVKSITRGSGERTVDMELQALSNVLSYGVSTNHIDVNVIKSNRPTFRKSSMIRRSRDVAPASGDAVHAIARRLLDVAKSRTLGWQMLFAAYTGCRTSELLRLRLDASTPDEPGFMTDGYLFLGRRSKRGVNPWIPIMGPFGDMLTAFLHWRRSMDSECRWFFPGRTGKEVVDIRALAHALRRVTSGLGMRSVTPHGLRSFYVTVRRSQGASDAQVAAEIGDSSPQVIPQSYGDLPANWSGGLKLSFTPAMGVCAWVLVDSECPPDGNLDTDKSVASG